MWGSAGILLAVLLLPALEAAVPVVGALLPGQTAVMAGGVLASHGHVSVLAALLAALGGALLGNLAGYAVGRHRHRLVLASLRRGGRFGGHMERALALIERRGGWAVFAGRFTAVLRTLVPTLCGALRMPLRPYLLWTLVSSALWAPAFVLIGYVAGPAAPG